MKEESQQTVGYIYGIKNNLNGRWYVGQTKRHVNIRWQEHRDGLVEGRHHSYKLQHDFNSKGLSQFDWIVLEEVKGIKGETGSDTLTAREKHWCDKLLGIKKGYNVLPPGEK